MAAEVLQPHHYNDVVTERAIDGLCGFPPCSAAAPRRGQGPKFHISASERKMYDISHLHNFCSRECACRSHEYASSLSTVSLYLRKGSAGAAAACVDDVRAPRSSEDNATPSPPAAASAMQVDGSSLALDPPNPAAPPANTAATSPTQGAQPEEEARTRPALAEGVTMGPVAERSGGASLPPKREFPSAATVDMIDGYAGRGSASRLCVNGLSRGGSRAGGGGGGGGPPAGAAAGAGGGRAACAATGTGASPRARKQDRIACMDYGS